MYLVYLLNRRANITVKTPFGDTAPFVTESLVKQGTVLGPVLNNYSLGDGRDESRGYQYGNIEIKPLEFVDDISDQNMGVEDDVKSNKIITDVIDYKKLNFSSDECRVLKVNLKTSETVSIDNVNLEVKTNFKYLGDIFNSKGNNSDMILERTKKAVSTIIELFSLSKGAIFGKYQVSNQIMLYKTVFLPRLLYNCETWTDLSDNDFSNFTESSGELSEEDYGRS